MRLLLSGLIALALLHWPAAGELVVHEWGTFTSIAGEDGLAIEWQPRNPSDLPRFVYGGLKGNFRGTVRMETPVLYFYAGRETSVSVRVDFPGGHITEWYPQAGVTGRSIEWNGFTVLPDATANFPVEKHNSRYYAARETNSATIRAGAQREKFLFYRGVGTFDLPLSAGLAGDAVRIKNLGTERIGHVILFENREGKVGYRIRDLLADEVAFDRPVLQQTVESLHGELAAILTESGLYPPEANAMIKTWSDSWFGEGLRVFYVVPREMTDAVLPITIEPKPAELVRVLVGRIEIGRNRALPSSDFAAPH